MSNTADGIEALLELSQAEPEEALVIIARMLAEEDALSADDLEIKLPLAVAYMHHALQPVIQEQFDFTGETGEVIRSRFSLRSSHLDAIERSLELIREIEAEEPGAFWNLWEGGQAQHKFDGMCILLERCRPGRVQETFGQTKLWYFGPDGLRHHVDVQDREMDFLAFGTTLFECPTTVRGAVITGFEFIDGREAMITSLYADVEPPSTGAGMLAPPVTVGLFFDDGSYRLTFDDRSGGLEQLPSDIQELLKDLQFGHEGAVLQALDRLASDGQGHLAAVRPLVLEAMVRGDGEVQVHGARTLASLGDTSDEMATVIVGSLDHLRGRAPDDLETTFALWSASEIVCEAASYVRNRPDVVDALMQIALDSRVWGSEPYYALSVIGDPAAREFLTYHAERGVVGAKLALALFGESDFETLQNFSDNTRRCVACGHIGEPISFLFSKKCEVCESKDLKKLV